MRLLRVRVSAPPLEVTGVITIKGVAEVEVIRISKKAVTVRHTINGGGKPDTVVLKEGDVVKSNIDIEVIGW